MKKIKLTQGKFTKVDDEDFEFLNQWKWCANKIGNTYYAIRRFKKKTVLMHRLIMRTPENMLTDHIDFNGLNNQKYNLRNCTFSQNNTYKKGWGSTSKFKGVNIDTKNSKKYRAQIKINGKIIHIGMFDTEEKAAQKYNEYALKYQGKFAYINKIKKCL